MLAARLRQCGHSQPGKRNRETLYSTVLLIEIIWHYTKSLDYLEDWQKLKKVVLCLCQQSSAVLFCHFLSLHICKIKWLCACGWRTLLGNNCVLFFFLQNLTRQLPTSSWWSLPWSCGLPESERSWMALVSSRLTWGFRQRSHPSQLKHFTSLWRPTETIKCATWLASHVRCTRLPLTQWEATPPLTFWRAVTYLEDLERTFPKRWLHSVSNKLLATVILINFFSWVVLNYSCPNYQPKLETRDILVSNNLIIGTWHDGVWKDVWWQTVEQTFLGWVIGGTVALVRKEGYQQ